MVYESEIQFTLDTICPWTFLSRRRLEKALAAIDPNGPVKFTVKYMPYQLNPNQTQEGKDKAQWYRDSKYGNTKEKMEMYESVFKQYGDTEGIKYKFTGTIANTLHAHRVIQHFQETKGPDVTTKLVDSLHRQYFEEERHPSSHETLLRATTDAGIPESEARPFIEDEDDGALETKTLIREQKGNGIDSVPYVVIQGKRRDFTFEGCRRVEEYHKAMEQVIKESS